MKRIILSLDGGGIRGAATAQFLKRLEAAAGKKISDCFDYFAGTSTGGLIAMHIAINDASGAECAELYTAENGSLIMNKSVWDRLAPIHIQTKPKYDGAGKLEFIKRTFKAKKFKSALKPVLITAYDIITRKIVVFKSTGGSDSEGNPSAAIIADATSAAPIYFPTVKYKSESTRWLIDGGIAANNPSMCALAEAIKDKIPLNEIYLISIGTGLPNRGNSSPDKTGESSQNWGSIEWLNNGLVDHIFSGNMEASHYLCNQILGKNYIRVNSYLDDAKDDMDDISNVNIKNLKETGNKWFDLHGASVIKILKVASKI